MNEPIGILISRVERTEGPLCKTHHWQCIIRVGKARYVHYCLTREAAVETSNRELMRLGVAIKPHRNENTRVGW